MHVSDGNTIVYKEYAVPKGDYKNASDSELKFAMRSGDEWAGAELMKRIRTEDTTEDRLRKEAQRNEELKKLDEGLYQEAKALSEALENV